MIRLQLDLLNSNNSFFFFFINLPSRLKGPWSCWSLSQTERVKTSVAYCTNCQKLLSLTTQPKPSREHYLFIYFQSFVMNSELRIASSVFSVGSLLYVSGICSMQLGQVLVSPGVGENKQTNKKRKKIS